MACHTAAMQLPSEYPAPANSIVMVPEERRAQISSAVGILSLPIEIRQNIFERVLAVAHLLYIFQDGPGRRVQGFAPGKPRQWLALLFTNRQISSEASAVLYAANKFSLMDTSQRQVDLLDSFLSGIGPLNATFLSYLCINFPVIEYLEGNQEKFNIREDGLRSLGLLQQRCTNLTALETQVHYLNSDGLTKTSQASSNCMSEGLQCIDQHLKSISSLQKIIIRVHDGSLIPSVKELMQTLGWVVLGAYE